MCFAAWHGLCATAAHLSNSGVRGANVGGDERMFVYVCATLWVRCFLTLLFYSPSASTVRAEHDAVLLSCGATAARDLVVPGRELQGIHLAMDFLTAHTHTLQHGLSSSTPGLLICE